MRRIISSMTLIVLLFNVVMSPLTYAQEFFNQENELIQELETEESVLGESETGETIVEENQGIDGIMLSDGENSKEALELSNSEDDEKGKLKYSIVTEEKEEENLESNDYQEAQLGEDKGPEESGLELRLGEPPTGESSNEENDGENIQLNQNGEDAIQGKEGTEGTGSQGGSSSEGDASSQGDMLVENDILQVNEESEIQGEEPGMFSVITKTVEEIITAIKYFFVKSSEDYITYTTRDGENVIILEDPESSEEIIIMDRNLGAESNEIANESSYGNYYQWGNNSGFEKVDETNATSMLAVYTGKYEGVGYTIDDKFRVGSNDIWKEDEEGKTSHNELWYQGEEEIQGPCPEGYHVPSMKEWNKIVRIWTKIHTIDENEGGKTVRSVKGDTLKASLEQAGTGDVEENTIEEENLTEVEELFMKELKLPKAGNYATNGEREDGLGIYWSRTPSDKPYQSEVFSIERYFGEDFNDDLLNRANGNSVRCFLDTKDKEVVEYNKEEITGEKTYDGVTVSVYAGTGFFPEGTKLEISAIKEVQEINDIKDQVSEGNELKEDAKLVAFDISFIYKGEEVQPLEGKVVKVTFDYSNNDELSESDKIDEQEVKVFHIDDKDEEGNKVEKGEEIVKEVTNIEESEEDGVVVADAESFSVYAIVTTTINGVTVTYNLNGGYWTEEGTSSTSGKQIVYNYYPSTASYRPSITYRTPSKAGNTCDGNKCMFMGWYEEGSNTRWKGNVVEDGMNVYARWQKFGDLDVYILGSDNDNDKKHYTLMDRNMGALDIYNKSETTTNINSESMGYYYQWGNNYGFDSYYETPNPLPESERITNSVNVSGFSWEHPYYGSKFYVNSGKPANWMKSLNKKLWGDDEIKTDEAKQGPCPEGYHVPSKDDWQGLLTSWKSINSRAEKNFYFDFLIPSAGIRDRGYSSKANVVDLERYRYASSSWNGQVFNDKSVIVLTQIKFQEIPVISTTTQGNLAHERSANGLSVRCLKNEENVGANAILSGIDLNGGTGAIISVISTSALSGEVVSLQNPSRGKDAFRGWYTTQDYSGNPIGIGSSLQQGDSLYAKWCNDGFVDDGTRCINGYDITFDSNGGSDVPIQHVTFGETGEKPVDPIRDGYSFDGWYTDNSYTTEFNFNTILTSNVTVYAKWSAIEYSINYILNEGSLSESNPETYTIESADITLNNPTKLNFDFLGWSGTNLVGSGNKTVTIAVGSTGNREYEANWKANKYQVTYKANGGEGEDVINEAIYDEHYEFLSNSFEKTGYSFVEWNTKADGSGSGFVEGFSGIWKTTTGVNLYAIWNENSYNVAYLGGEGAIGSKAGFMTGYTNTFVLTDNEGSFIKTGYTFSGWTYDGKHYAAGTELSRLATENGATVIFTAEWNVVPYTISYEYNNGTGSNPVTYQVDTPSFALNNPTRTGYTFIGWSGTELEGSDNTNVTIVIGSVGDREYEANWQANKYNVTYKANGGEGVDVVEEATYDAKYVFKGNKFTRIGYEFVEWNTKADGTGTGYAEGFSGIWKTATGVNLFAQWIAETYTVTFDGNEGEVTGITDKDVIFDSVYGDLSTASRTGYTFTGWYTEAVVGEKVESDTIVATASNHTLYAHWDENSYNVVYEGGEGTEGIVTGTTYKYTENFNLAANNFTKKGYVFSGWTYDGKHYAAGTLLSGLATEDGSTVTFIAEWNVVPYSIHYELDGGIFSGVVNPTTYTVNSATINVGNPERVGYIFSGWTGTDLSALTTKVVITGGSIGDRTYYANWQPRDDIKITVNHYLQDLDVDNNTVLDTYSISGTIEEEGTADSIVDISDYQQSIAGYSYGSGKVDGSVVSTTTVSPDGSRVIDLFYTRNSYSYAITTSVGSSTEGSSSNGNYYYGAKIILSGDSNNDCFLWSGWAVQGATLENNMKQTSFIMPANDVTANSLVREKTYNIVFNGNGEDSGTMSPLNGIRCTQEFTLPENSFVKTGYTFTGWTTIPNGVKEFDNKATIQTLTTGDNVTIEFIAIWDANYYPIVWKDYDGDVLYEDEFPYMEIPEYHGEIPSRDADEQYTYTFTGWTPEEHVVTGSQVYTAVYNKTLNEYTVTWDVNGTKTMETYKYGETPNFTGSKHKNPDEQYEYSFAGWTPEISSVTGDITYTATYTSTLRKYPIVWLNYDGSELRSGMVQYGDIPEYGGATPTRPSEPEHTYEFIGWSDGINDYDVNDVLPAVEGEATYFARFSGTQNEYTIIWLNYNNHLLEMDTGVVYGSIPSYDGETPTKESDAQYTYEFSGWSPATGTVVGDQTYIATYVSIPRTYTVTWKNSDGSTIKQQTGISYGTVVEYVGDVPTSGSSAEYDYEFISWNPTPGEIDRDTTYTAMYKANKRKYLIRFVNGETELQSGMVEYGVTPVYTGDEPTKSGDAQYSYHYVGWNPGISAVTGNMTYEAKFNSTVNKYSVTFVNYDGVSVVKPASEYDYGTSWEDVEKPEDNPTKPQDAQYTYEFSGWIPVVTEITGDVMFKAVYSGIIRTYTVTWKNDDGTVLETDNNVPYGTTPAYNGSTPIKPETSQHKYVFIGWEPAISDVSGDITYIAQFAESSQMYTITWVDEDGTELEVDTGVVYGSIPSYDGETPTKESDAQYDYVFAGWSPATGIVVGDQIYSATYTSVLRTYTVTWKNGAIVLKTDYNVPHGSTPVYNGSTPVRTGNAQYSYSFDKWAPDVGPISSDTTYNATFDEIINKYVVTWDNYDGTELSSEEVEYGTLPTYTGSTPTRPKTAQYTYIFSNSWLPAVTAVTTGATYTALFNLTVNEYTITWKDGDGNTLKTEQVAYDETPEYTGATPTKTATAQYTYSFNNTWSPEVQSVTGDMTYTAQFDSTVNEYSVTWVDGDGVILKTDQVAYGDIPEYKGEIPTKTPTAEHTYTFKGWSPAIKAVDGDITYTAVFDGDVNEYSITWLDGDGNTLKTDTLEYGQTPAYDGATPTKTSTDKYTYTFNGTWSPAIQTVSENATYTAQFDSTVNEYTVIWKDGDGNTLKTDQVAYDETPAYVGDTPTKTATAQYTYTFNNTWSPAVQPVTGNITYTAQFDSGLNYYTITWKDGDDKTLYAESLAYGITPAYAGATPTKTATVQYSYTFNDTWSPEIEDVTTGATYTAQFTPVLNKYTIVWKDWNGTILKLAEELEYGTHPVYGLEDPTREGDAQYSYTFNGWNHAVQDVTGPQVYTATYLQTVNKYRIIFLNDDDSEITSKQVEYGTTVANYKPDDPTKEGYTFNGWNPNLVTVVTGATYKATYTINQYTLTPELGVGLESIEGGGTFDYGTEVIFTGYAKEGYHFEGGERVKAFTVTVGAHNATVRINAIANKYVVKFQPNEGDGTMQDQEFAYDLTGILHANSFRRSGYTFTGWIDEFGNYYADQGKVYNLATGGVVEFTALWKVGEDKPVEPTPAAGGGRIIPKEDKDQEHGSADTQTGGTGDIDSGTQYTTGDIIPGDGSWTQEEMDAYKYAYKYHITTLAPREAARPDEYVIRGHMAKMVVNYAVNVLGWKLPEKLPKQCKWNDGVDAWESQEIKDYAEKACALGLMGIDMNYFQPNKYVTRAQFGTIFGRLLRGKLPSTPYYAGHLSRLKENGIMTQIDNPEDRIEIRKRAWLMFMRSEKYFKVK